MVNYMEAYIESIRDSTPSYHDAIRMLLAPEFADLSDKEIDELLENVLEGMAPEEIEGFWSTLKGFARSAAQFLPAVGTVVGTAVGGPAGAALGGTLGRIAGHVLGRTQRRPTRRIPVTPPPTPRPIAAPLPSGGTSALNQLMALIQNPVFLQSLLGQALGRAGQGHVRIGRQGVAAPFGAFMNALAQLATQAAMEANAKQKNAEETPEYLLREDGEFACDPANPAERARRLLELLHETSTAGQERDMDKLTEWFAESGMLTSLYPRRRRPE